MNVGDGIEYYDDKVFDVEKVHTYAIFFIEFSLFNYYFVIQKQSRIVLASILNTMEGLGLFKVEDVIKVNLSIELSTF